MKEFIFYINDKRHLLRVRWSDFLCHLFYFLDGRKIDVDDEHGYIYSPSGKAVPKELHEALDTNISKAVKTFLKGNFK